MLTDWLEHLAYNMQNMGSVLFRNSFSV